MKARQFRTYILPLLLILVIGGVRIANAWDFSDIHSVQALHIDHADLSAADTDDTKKNLLILPFITPLRHVLPLPAPATFVFHSTTNHLIHPLAFVVLSLPSRASPA